MVLHDPFNNTMPFIAAWVSDRPGGLITEVICAVLAKIWHITSLQEIVGPHHIRPSLCFLLVYFHVAGKCAFVVL